MQIKTVNNEMVFFDSIAIPQFPSQPDIDDLPSLLSPLSSSQSQSQSASSCSSPSILVVPSSAGRPSVSSRKFTETFRGFVKDPLDAALLIEVIVLFHNAKKRLTKETENKGLYCSFIATVEYVLVFAENSSMGQMVRWRDGCRWSASRLQGPFLLYREVETSTTSSNSPPDRENDPPRFINTVVRGKTRFVINGLAKRTLTLSGSDGNRYRVISYFYPSDVGHLYGDPVVPSSFASSVTDKIDIGSSGRLSCPSSLPQFSQLLGAVCVPQLAMPDLSYATLSRASAGSNLLALAQQQYSSPILTSSISLSSSSGNDCSIGEEEYPSPQQQNMLLLSSVQQEQAILHSCNSNGGESDRIQPLLKAVDLLRNDPQWTERPVQLAPLTGSTD
ncbi:hypothetical protein HK100_007836 [Physocladia obscura]|uniref:Uncharacterized protein n=1 Tax=Physocladia obscura TaxID=109957 RepID=A0AAD5SNX8_9FUNG|nr:hypothetical protein HK100_007836 [Physocladia obscura]